MNHLVKILTDDSGEPREKKFQTWCLIVYENGTNRAFCSGEAFGGGDSACDYERKTVKRGGITCEKCIDRIKEIKAIKL